MSELFESARLKLSGAKEELQNLHAEITKFGLKLEPYAPVIYPDPDGAGDTHAMKLSKTPAIKNSLDRMSLLCSRIASELRDALDQAGYASAVAEGAHADPKLTYFPVCKEVSEFDNTIKRRCKHLPADIVTLFRGFKAHPGGDELLVALNNLAGSGKHKIIEPVMQGSVTTAYQALVWGNTAEVIRPLSGKWDPVKKEVPLFWVKRGANPYYKLHMSLFIAFGEIDIVGGCDVTAVYETIAPKVENIINATETECRRLGFIV
jgi:hypothetical protein